MTVEELAILEPTLRRHGWCALNPKTTRALCMFDRDMARLAGFSVIQMMPYIGPEFVFPEYRGKGLSEEMHAEMKRFGEEVGIRGFMVVADSAFTQQMCEAEGLKKLEVPVYVAQVSE